MTRLAAVIAVCLCLAGCARHSTGPRTYQLQPQILAPPAAPQPMQVGGVAGPAWSSGKCSVRVEPFSLEWKSGKALLRSEVKDPQALNLMAVERFREAVMMLEANGCLKTNGAQTILDGFASILTAHSSTIYAARWGNYYQSSALDVQPQFRLKVTGPIFKPGFTDVKVTATIPDKPGPIVATISEGLEGFETSYYRIKPAKPEGVTLELLSVEQNRQGVATTAQKPVGFAPSTSKTPVHMRLLFLRRKSQSDRDITLLSAPTLVALEAAALRIQSAPDAAEQCRAEREATCQLMPRLTAVNLELLVLANGREVSIPVGATVHNLIQATGVKDWSDVKATLPTLAVLRPWRGKLTPVSVQGDKEELFRLVLIGGEKVTW